MSFSNNFSRQSDKTELVSVQLPNGSIAKIEVSRIGGQEDVFFGLKPLSEIGDAIEGIVQAVAIPIQKAKPKKATIKLGLELAIESGQLMAVIVKGTGKANLEITLEWENQPGA
jgi:hypothetical protein